MPDDLDSFLQRAAQQRQKRKQAEIVILEPSSPAPAPPPRSLTPSPPPRPVTPPPLSRPVVVIAEPVTKREDISQHVATHLDSREFEQRASQLGERVGLADDQLEAHLHHVFDHNVGSMGKTGQTLQSAQDLATTQMSLQILAAFRDPQSMRRAIILNEVLTPPMHRW